MMNSVFIYSLLRIIPYALILIASILILKRTKSSGAILMVVGWSVNILPLLLSFATPIISHQFSYDRMGIVYSISGGVSLIASIIFGIGLLLLAKENFKEKEIFNI